MPSLVGVDGFPAVVVSVPSVVEGVVSLQKLAPVVFPYRWEDQNTGYANTIKCSMFSFVHLHESFIRRISSMQLYKE